MSIGIGMKRRDVTHMTMFFPYRLKTRGVMGDILELIFARVSCERAAISPTESAAVKIDRTGRFSVSDVCLGLDVCATVCNGACVGVVVSEGSITCISMADVLPSSRVYGFEISPGVVNELCKPLEGTREAA